MTDAVGIWGLVVGGIGSAAGVGALVYAHIANSNAKKSSLAAGDSKQLAEQANDLARESNTIATDAKQLAEEANGISRRSEARDTEQHDVCWDEGWTSKAQGIFRLVKRGDDEAHNVKATVEFDNEEVVIAEPLVANDYHQLLFRFGSAAYDRERAAIADAARTRSMSVQARLYPVRVRVEWTTKLGTPQLYETAVPTMLV
ncbi:hypothetical protein A5792_11590 [Mycolicibacterium peregrinum]|uniref:Uncharacterized protein n=1 Tax=Mycolicibacterium peregrinum TaxID=43304 RepID=A0A1A0RH88_MYCPR|nr:hypothetical protein [Mycolicibacterium peregrinum]OBB33064.1 hypothetical protein A5792_11590 [Mycolicibacterium peregrinum]